MICLEDLTETTKSSVSFRLCWVQDLNQRHTEYGAHILPTIPQTAVG